MSDELSAEPDDRELRRLLDNPALWAEPSAAAEDNVVAAIAAQLSSPEQSSPTVVEDQSVVDLGERRARRTGSRRFWPLAAAAALLIIVISATAGFTLGRSGDSDLTTVALAAADPAYSASAVARIDERPNGARLLVNLSDLEPAPLGHFYEVWLVKADPRTVISAGTFHMRGSDSGEIEFWAGVSPQVYRTITVTLESEADPTAPGELILEGLVPAS